MSLFEDFQDAHKVNMHFCLIEKSKRGGRAGTRTECANYILSHWQKILCILEMHKFFMI